MITEQQYKRAKAAILKLIFVDHLNYNQVAATIKEKYGLDYEAIAYRMDDDKTIFGGD